MSEIDKIDADIVNLLIEDGRMPCAEIARRVGGVSERSVRYRLQRLVDDGMIKITANIIPARIGYPIVADVWLEVDSDKILEVARELATYECISYVACAIGENDVSLQVVGRDTSEVYRFVTEVVGKTPGVRRTTTSIVPMVLKDTHEWRVPTRECAPENPKDKKQPT
jgi:Lrp/AsnC family transcriptional regulator for asnA, asnC and gidA